MILFIWPIILICMLIYINDTLRLPPSVPHLASCIFPKGNEMLAFDEIQDDPPIFSLERLQRAIKGITSNLYLLEQEREEAQNFS